jgi:peptidoglycan/xylan/chitin deacetylase (PgdA/CDA1 family)
MDPALDRLRTARLLLDREPPAGALEHGALGRATRVRSVSSRPARVVDQVLYKLGALSWERNVSGPFRAARASVLGARATGPPRFLVRVDEFPHYRAWDEPRRFGTEAFGRFHEIMSAAGVPYLVAALPRVSREPLSPEPLGSRPWDDGEAQMAGRLKADGVAFAVHGLDHRTRAASPRRHSEMCGLTSAEVEALLERALAELDAHDLRPDVFVAPYNRFDASQLELLARRFAVVGGGPESIGTLGFQRSPQWRGQTVYLPSYAPFYGRAATVLGAVERAIEQRTGLWTPVVLHWGWEAEEGWRALERLAELLAPYAAPWPEFLATVASSRGEGS